MLLPFAVTAEAGYTSSLADFLCSMGSPPVLILTDEDIEKEVNFFKNHPIRNDFDSLKNTLPQSEKKCYTLSGIIRFIQVAKGLSESELARRSGYSVSSIHGIECGNNKNPGFRVMYDLSRVLGFSLDELAEEVFKDN